jgi:hypothetical protein
MHVATRFVAQAALALLVSASALAQQPSARERVVARKACLEAKGKNLTVTAHDSGYRKAAKWPVNKPLCER